MAELKLSSALIVESDTPLGDCIRRMRDHETGSVLVIASTFPKDLVGIFTERDLLKWIDKIQYGGYWEKPVASLMSKPVQTVSIYDLDKAPRMMLDAGIRHLPVVYEDEAGCRGVAGVISIKDLFRRLSELLPAAEPTGKGQNHGAIAVAGLDEKSRHALGTLLGQKGQMPVIEMMEHGPAKVGELADRRTVSIVALDLDGYRTDEVLACLQAARAKPDGPPILLVFSPAAHSPKNVAFFKDLAKTERFAAMPKPLGAIDVLNRIRVWRGSRVRLG